jgi:hypothetical protein
VNFLVRTIAAALLALSPGAWAARRRDNTPAQRGVLIGLAAYLFVGSLVDLYAFINGIVGAASVPSIAVRAVLGAVIVWLIPVPLSCTQAPARRHGDQAARPHNSPRGARCQGQSTCDLGARRKALEVAHP